MPKAFRYDYGDFVVFGSWIKTADMKDEEPCLCIGGKRFDRKRAWVIPLSMAHEYADSVTGAPTAHLVASSTRIADLLGLEMNRSSVFKIAGAIVDALPDLLKMPHREEATQAMIDNAIDRAGLRMRVNGETVLGG